LYLEIVGDPDGHEEICLELSPLLGIGDAARALSAQLTLQVRHTALKEAQKMLYLSNTGCWYYYDSRFLKFGVKNRFERFDLRVHNIGRDEAGWVYLPTQQDRTVQLCT
jgi:hypothetical protein